MLRRLSIGLLVSAIPLASLPAIAQEDGSADDLGVMSISLKDVVKPQVGFQGALQGAGTPNQAGLGGFLPLSVGENGVVFADVQANVNFADREGYSSIINTDVAGTTISTSSRLGYRWLNSDRSWMFGVNGGYDSRPLTPGPTDTGVSVADEKTVFFQQLALNVEAVSDKWSFNGYGLLPVVDVEQRINSAYQAGALATFGFDLSRSITPALSASVGSYYQHRNEENVDGIGALAQLSYAINNDLSISAKLSYDDAFDTRFSADIKWRFNAVGGLDKASPSIPNAIKAVSESPGHREIRVHDELPIVGDEYQGIFHDTYEELADTYRVG